MAVLYSDLLTGSELETAAIKSLPGITTASYLTEIEGAIGDVTDIIEEFLDRKLIVRKYTQRLSAGHWRYHPILRTYAVWSDAWPVAETETPVDADSVAVSGMTISAQGPITGGSQRWLTTDQPQEAFSPYFAGYRRSDHVLSSPGAGQVALQAQTGLADLGTLPELLPRDIRRAAIELSIEMLRSAAQGTLGSGRRMQQIGSGQMVTVESVDREFRERILEGIRHHRRYV